VTTNQSGNFKRGTLGRYENKDDLTHADTKYEQSDKYFDYSEVHYSTTDKSKIFFYINYHVITDCIRKSKKKFLKGTTGTTYSSRILSI
jgi:hypothetical protein